MANALTRLALRVRKGGVVPGLMALVALALWGCRTSPSGRLEGYTWLEGQTYYRLWSIGERGEQARPGDYITVYLRYLTDKDSAFFEGGRRFQLERPSYGGAIEQCLALLAEGDSASFVLPAYDFFTKTLATTLPPFIDSAEQMRIDVRMLSVVDSLSFEREKEAFVHWIKDFGEYEQVILRQYLAREHIDTHMVDSLYYLPVRAGSGPYPEDGDTVTVEFEGRFLDGTYFDSTRKRGEAFQFVLGEKWQVIDGLERAIRLMREGEQSLFILPSSIAFGPEGSSTGIVPPYTSVIFEVELTEIKPGDNAS